MKHIIHLQVPSLSHSVRDSTHLPIEKLTAPPKPVIALAAAATLASLGIATLVGWQSGGMLIERLMCMAFIGVAVLAMHWLPLGWSTFRGISRLCAFVLWNVATAVVLFRQATFFTISQRRADGLRAESITAQVVPTNVDLYPVRLRTEVAKDTAKLSAEAAPAQIQHRAGDCPRLRVRRAHLPAEISALGVEAGEKMRREASEDRRKSQAERDDDWRATLRADPVVFPVAVWLGTTERRLELILGLASAVVLESAAIVGWTSVAVAWGRDADRSVIVRDYRHGAPETDPTNEAEPSRAVKPEEDQFLDRIRTAAVSDKLKPTLNSIRNFLRYGQPEAGKLNRLYLEKFGSMQALAATTHHHYVALSRLSTEEVK